MDWKFEDNETHKYRVEMIEHLYYLQLASSITTKTHGGIMNKSVKETLINLRDFIVASSEADFLLKRNEVQSYMFKLYRNYKFLFKPKLNQRKVGKDFNELFSDNQNPYSHGIEYGWINERIEYVKHPWPEDLPYQARIGIGAHFPSVGIEEEFMLRDSFFFLAKALEGYENMMLFGEKFKEENDDIETSDQYRVFSNYNQTIASYSRIGTQSFYFFTEAFVNSVGYDFLLKNKNILSETEMETLQGKNKGRFIPLEYRIQKFQSIIRADKKIVINTTDVNQIKEPFSTFFNEIKEIRDATSHFTPVKGDIWYKPEEWMGKIEMSAKISLEVARQFWNACYPSRDYPEYLMKLDYEEHLKTAKERLEDIGDYKSI